MNRTLPAKFPYSADLYCEADGAGNYNIIDRERGTVAATWNHPDDWPRPRLGGEPMTANEEDALAYMLAGSAKALAACEAVVNQCDPCDCGGCAVCACQEALDASMPPVPGEAGLITPTSAGRHDRREAALRKVLDIIEQTYAHDEDGNRTDGDSPISGADVVEMLCALEDDLRGALETKP